MDLWFGTTLWVCAIITFGCFSAAVRLHFRSTQMPTGMKAISALSLVSFAAFNYLAFSSMRPSSTSVPAILLVLGAFGLFVWAIKATRSHHFKLAFDPASPEVICDEGPYRFVRHPFYLSYAIFWIGTTVGTQSLLMALLTVCLTSIYIYAALREEASFAHSELAPLYHKYRQTTGFIIPKMTAS